jgi:hypothetical protein
MVRRPILVRYASNSRQRATAVASLIPLQLPFAPVVFFPIGIEHPLDAVQRFHDADPGDIVGPPFSATRINASIAACHSAAAWTFSESPMM